MHAARDTVTTPSPSLARLATLALRNGLSMGTLATGHQSDFALVLAAAGCAFALDEALDEREVNERLKRFLAGAGAMLAVDHVELRRWLVDNGVLTRDGFGRRYARGTPRAEIVAPMQELAGVDLAALVAEVRARDAERRAARKDAWERRSKDAA
ncbi:MAG: DUF2087 domain-containing protein [Burkholderiales bacterium]